MSFLHGNFYIDKHLWGCVDRLDGRTLIDVALTLPFDKWCLVLKSFTRKEGKNSMAMLFCLQNCEIDNKFLLMEGTHKTSFKLKVIEGVEDLVCSVWAIGILIPSLMTTLSLPSNLEWIAKFCKSKVMWCEAPKSTIQLCDECPIVVLKFAWGLVYNC